MHPLVDLLLNNLTLTYVGLDEHTNYALRKFVELRLGLNKQCFLEVLQKFAGAQLEQDEQEQLQEIVGQNLKSPAAIVHRVTTGKSVVKNNPQVRSVSNIRQRQLQKVPPKVSEESDSDDGHKVVQNIVAKRRKEERSASAQTRVTERKKQKQAFRLQTAEGLRRRERVQNRSPMQRQSDSDRALSIPSMNQKKMMELQEIQNEIQKQRKELLRIQNRARLHSNSENSDDAQELSVQKTDYKPQEYPVQQASPVIDKTSFDQILNAAYDILMQRADNDKARALALFTRNQEKILGQCERVMQSVEAGETRPEDVRRALEAALGLE